VEVYSGDKPLTKDEREELKAILWEEQRKLAYFPWLIEKFGAQAGLFVSQLLYWDGKGHDPDGWIYKTEKDMQRETGLTRSAQRKARKVLVGKGMLEEDKRGIPRKLYYRANLRALMALLDAEPPLSVTEHSNSKDLDFEYEFDDDTPF
jgi:hypothetical protein